MKSELYILVMLEFYVIAHNFDSVQHIQAILNSWNSSHSIHESGRILYRESVPNYVTKNTEHRLIIKGPISLYKSYIEFINKNPNLNIIIENDQSIRI